MLRRSILLLTLLVGLIACKNDSSPGVQLIDLTGDLNNQSDLLLSDIASNIEYVQLEASKYCYLQYMRQWSISDNYILVYEHMQQKIFLFNRDGKFLCQISKSGKGPGEFFAPDQVMISKDESTIYVLNWKKLLKFSIEGVHLGTINFEAGPRAMIEYGNNFLMAFKFPDNIDFGGYSFGMFNREGELLEKYVPTKTGLVNTSNDLRMYGPYIYQDTISYFTLRYDTVFGLSPEFEPYPRMIFKTSSRQIPPSERKPTDVPSNGFWMGPHRETPQHVYIFGGIDREMHRLIIDRKTKEVMHIENDIPNDIDGGYPFWPDKVIGNKEYKLIHSNKFTYYRDQGYYYGGEVKYPERKKIFDEMVDSIDENDNPILVIVTLKK